MRPSTGLLLAAIGAAVSSVCYSRSTAADTTISDCDSISSGEWKYSYGPNATGSLTSATGHSGGSGRLAYDVAQGGKWVYASHSLSTPISPSLIALWMRLPLGTKAALQLVDSAGQTFEYELVRTLEGSLDVDRWYRVLVNVAVPTSFFGGPNDGVFRPPFSKVGILAFPEAGTNGWVEFDDIVAIDQVIVQVDPETPPLFRAREESKSFLSRLGINVHAPNREMRERELDIAAAAGFSIARVNLDWSALEPAAGTYDLSALDSNWQSLRQRGMRMHVILGYHNGLYPRPDASGFASQTIPAFAAMSKAVAAHLSGQNVTYEVWNEPNEARFWPDSAGASVYAALCKAAVAAVHEGDSSAQVAMAGLAGFDFDFMRTMLATGTAMGANAIGVHPYRRGAAETIGSDLLKLRVLLSETIGTSLPVWATEWGYTTAWFGNGHGASERVTQARLLTRALLSSAAVELSRIFVYDLRDDGDDPANPEHNFGLVQSDTNDKPAIVAVRTLSKVARNRSYLGILNTNMGGVHALRWDGTADTVVAVWSENEDVPIDVELPSMASTTDMLGGSPATTPRPNGKVLRVVADDGPVYISFPKTTDGGAPPAPPETGDAGMPEVRADVSPAHDSLPKTRDGAMPPTPPEPADAGPSDVGGDTNPVQDTAASRPLADGPQESADGIGSGGDGPGTGPASGCACTVAARHHNGLPGTLSVLLVIGWLLGKRRRQAGDTNVACWAPSARSKAQQNLDEVDPAPQSDTLRRNDHRGTERPG